MKALRELFTWTEMFRKPIGVVTIMEHKEPLNFVWINKETGQGYYEVPKWHERLFTPFKYKRVKNLIVNRASLLMAKRMAPGASWGAGITHIEVGTGVGTGTTQAPQAEEVAQTALRVPLTRKALTTWTFIDAGGNPTASETGIIEFSVNFGAEEAIGALVEMGLFGGNATVTNGTGYMFNYKVFSVWNKQSGMQLTITWRITF
jgi:hypothetical protein